MKWMKHPRTENSFLHLAYVGPITLGVIEHPVTMGFSVGVYTEDDKVVYVKTAATTLPDAKKVAINKAEYILKGWAHELGIQW